jgi:hypothetical protein
MSDSHGLYSKASGTSNEINPALDAKCLGVKSPGRIQPTHDLFKKKDSVGSKQKRGV